MILNSSFYVDIRMKKIHLNLYINEEIVDKAREVGINLSKFFEHKLQEYMSFINGKTNNQISANKTSKRVCRVAWHPCSFGSYRPEFKSQQAHIL